MEIKDFISDLASRFESMVLKKVQPHDQSIKKLLRGFGKLVKRNKEKYVLRCQVYTEPHRALTNDPLKVGEQRIETFRSCFKHYVLNGRPAPPRPKQRTLIQAFLRASLPFFYSVPVYERHYQKIVKGRQIDPWILVCAQRRFGKSVCLAQFAAALAFTVPGIKILIIAKSIPQATALLNMVSMFLYQLPGIGNRAYQIADRITVKSAQNPTCELENSTITCMPANVDGRRGITGQFVLFEEAAFIPFDAFKKLAVALMSVRHTVFIAITTASDKMDNWFTKKMALKDDRGDTIFKIFAMSLLCKTCTNEKKSECPHQLLDKTEWSAHERQYKKIKLLMGDGGDYKREILGVPDTDDRRAFDEKLVARLNERIVPLYDQPSHVFIGLDPTGGGEMSQMAMCSLVIGLNNVAMVTVCL